MKLTRIVLILAVSLLFAGFLIHNKARVAGPEIVGSGLYGHQVRQALLLLEARDTNAFAMVTNYFGRIQEGAHSGMWAYLTPPTYEMADTTAFYSLTWCAGTIAHDSFHSKLYRDYKNTHGGPVPDDAWSGEAAERLCMKHQLAVMERIGAPQLEIDWAKTQADGHYIINSENWSEYNNRKW